MPETYKIKIAGLERDLSVCPINENLSIAAFILFSDVEMTVAASRELLRKVPEFDVIITPEAKSIPLAYEMARQSGKNYVVARKNAKLYMREPFSVEVNSITTMGMQKLYLGQDEAKLLKDKKVLVADDVISTGESLAAVLELVKIAGGNVVSSCAVLAEGDAAERTDIVFLEKLPLISENEVT